MDAGMRPGDAAAEGVVSVKKTTSMKITNLKRTLIVQTSVVVQMLKEKTVHVRQIVNIVTVTTH
jgi:hypothetical protein